MKIDKKPDLYLRITVESGGCHGFQYLMSLTDKVDLEDDMYVHSPPSSLISHLQCNTDILGLILIYRHSIFDQDGAKVVMDESSLHLLKGSRIDYTMELIGSQFKIVDNPHATSSCGYVFDLAASIVSTMLFTYLNYRCGTSFDIKI